MASLAVKRHFCSTTAQYSVLHSLNDSVACGIFLGQGSNPGPLHCEADSSPLAHQGRPPPFSLSPFFFFSGHGRSINHENMGIDMQILKNFQDIFRRMAIRNPQTAVTFSSLNQKKRPNRKQRNKHTHTVKMYQVLSLESPKCTQAW